MLSQTPILHTSKTLGWQDLVVEHIQLRADELYLPPLHHHQICMSLDANFKVEQARNGQVFVHNFKRGEAQLLPIGTEGLWRYQQDAQVIHLQLPHHLIQNIAQEITRFDPANVELSDQFLLHDPQVEHISFALFSELLEGGKNGKLYRDSLSTALTVHLLQKYATGTLQSRPLPQQGFGRVLEYIDSHLTEDISLATLAQTANISTSHFTALFKQSIGVSPYQYILTRRVKRAQELLIHSNLTVAQVASEVGFYDQSHLTRHMRRLLKITPAVLQRQRNVQNLR